MILMAEGTLGAILQLIGASTVGIFVLCVLIAWSNAGNNRTAPKKTYKRRTANNKRYNKTTA